MSDWELVVGNVGTVYSGANGFQANAKFQAYKSISMGGVGRAGGEDVVLLRDGEIVKEYNASHAEEETE